jgi:hypothetical protein
MNPCPRCSGLIVLNHDEWLCLNCSYRPANDIRPVFRERLRCYYCGKRPPDLERSNLACHPCLDRQIHYKRKKWDVEVEA